MRQRTVLLGKQFLVDRPADCGLLRRGRKRNLALAPLGVVAALLAGILTLSPPAAAQNSASAGDGSNDAKNQGVPGALSHDLSGVWMQYRDGDVPGTPGMNGVNEHFRPPLTPWGQEQVSHAQALQGDKAIAGKEDNSALRCEPSGPPPRSLSCPIPGRSCRFPDAC